MKVVGHVLTPDGKRVIAHIRGKKLTRMQKKRRARARKPVYDNKVGRNGYVERVRTWTALRTTAPYRKHFSQLLRYETDEDENLDKELREKLKQALVVMRRIQVSAPSEAGSRSVSKKERWMADFRAYFKLEKRSFRRKEYHDLDRVKLLSQGCEMIRRWLDQPDRPVGMFMSCLAVVREIFLSACKDETEPDQVEWYGLVALRQAFKAESPGNVGRWEFCFKYHYKSWRQLSMETQDTEDDMRFAMLEEKMTSARALKQMDAQMIRIRKQMSGPFFVPKCCNVPRTQDGSRRMVRKVMVED